MIIVGGGGHGLATAYYLAKEHGITNVAVLEKSYLGSGNVGRNTTIVRSNYLLPGNIRFYEHSMKLWEGLEPGAQLQHHGEPARRAQRLSTPTRSATPMRGAATPCASHGVDAELLDARRSVRESCRSSTSTMPASRSVAG